MALSASLVIQATLCLFKNDNLVQKVDSKSL